MPELAHFFIAGSPIAHKGVLREVAQLTSPSPQYIGPRFFGSDHKSWFNAMTNPNAPVLSSRYNVNRPPGPLTWYGEIIAAATDGSNTVWRFAHNHNGYMTDGYFTSAFAQISNDGRWAIFSSHWGGTLGSSNGDFGTGRRIDTFIVELR